jgi:hypothetical protein
MKVAYALYQRHLLAVFTSPSARDEMCGNNLDFDKINARRARKLFHGKSPSRFCTFGYGYKSFAGYWLLPLHTHR